MERVTQVVSKMEFIIICHAGVGIGVGHLSRCLIVAKALKNRFASPIYIIIQGNKIDKPELGLYETDFISSKEDLAEKVKKMRKPAVKQVFIFDLHHGSINNSILELLAKMKKSDCITIGIDALIKYHSLLDMVFMPTFKQQPGPLPGSDTKIIRGWDCFLLNTLYDLAPSWTFGTKILVLTGGSDTTGLGNTFPDILNTGLNNAEAEINWVVGPYADQPVIPRTHNMKWIFHQAPQSLDDLMVKTNFAISVYGVSFYELLHYGIPTVVFSPYGNKDDEELTTIAAEEVALVANNELDALDKLKKLMADSVLSSTISVKAKTKLSNSNGQRFVSELDELIKIKWQKDI